MQKRLMIIAILLFVICNKIAAADQVTISDFSIFTGQTKDVSISLTNDKAYAAFQFDLVLPEGITVVEPVSPDTWNSHKGDRIPSTTDLSMQQQSDGSYRFVAMPGTTTIQDISGSEGVIINLTLSAAATAAVGNQTGYFRNIKLSTSDGVATNGNTISELSFTFATRGDEAYAVLSDENTKLTFYYDKQKDERGGMSVGPFELTESGRGWNSVRESITTVVFDESFANYTDLTSTMWWFYGLSNLTTITNIEYLNTSNVTNMVQMFGECTSLTSLDLRSFNTSKVTDMHHMFSFSSNLTSIDLSSFNTTNVIDMGRMFYGCSSLANLDLSNFNTENVTNMDYLFSDCSSLTGLDLSGFNTANVTDMKWMFNNCTNLTSLNISNFKTDNVTNMWAMFKECKALTSLNLSSFNTAIVEDMRVMFSECNSLQTIYVGSNWSTTSVTESDRMFDYCNSIIGGQGTTFVSGNNGLGYAHIDGGVDNPGYLTSIDDNASVAEVSFSRYGLELTLECATENVEIYYNFSTEASDVWHKYTGPITLSEDCIITAYAKRPSGISSAQTSYTFSMSDVQKVDTPTSSWNGDVLTLSCLTDGATIYYTNSAEVAATGTVSPTIHTYEQPFEVTQDAVFEIWAAKAGMQQSDTLIIDYNYTAWNALKQAIDNAKVVASQAATNDNVTDAQRAELANWISTAEEAYAARTGSVNEITQMTNELSAFTETVNALVQAVNEPYAVLSDDNTKLTFYYDKKKNERNGMNVGPFELPQDRGWESITQNITAVEFDASMADNTTITSTAYWFYGCQELSSITGMNNLKTQSVTDMKYMFHNCNVLELVDVSGFNTANVTDMSGMFYKCHRLHELDLANFNTTKVKNMSWMFYGCNDITKIYVGSYWTTTAVTESEEMFTNCTNIVGGAGTTYNESHVDAIYARVDDPYNDKPGYFTDKHGVTLIAKDYTREYGEDNPTFEYTVEGAEFSGKPTITCAADKTSPVGTYPIVITYTEAAGTRAATSTGSVTSDLHITCVNGTLTITKAPLKATAKSYTIKRGAELPTFEVEFSGFKNNETETVLTKKAVATCEAKSDTLPGTYQIVVSGAEAQNYEMEYVNGTLTITDDAVVTAKSYTREYGEENPTFEYTVEGAMLDGTPAITCEATATSPVGTYDIVISKGNVTNREITYVNGTLTITKAPLKATAKSYTIKRGAELPTFEVEYSGFKNNETEAVLTKKAVATCEAKSDTLPGTYQIVVSGAEAQNYEMEYVNGTLTITDDAVVTAKSYTREYGEENPTFEYTVEGAMLDGTPAITCEATATSPVGTYDIVISKGNVTNREITYVNGTLTITKVPLKATAKSYTIKRGAELPTFEVEYSGFKNNETEAVLTKKAVATCEAKSDTLPGTYQIVVSGAEAQNYEMEYVNGTLTITDDAVVTAKSYTREYGEENPTFEYTVEGAMLDGTPAITCEATATSPVGTYDIVISKGNVTNREITYVNGTLTITKAPLKATAKSYTIKRGAELPTFEVEYSGFKNNETETVLTKKAVATCEAKSDTLPGTYQIVVSGAEAQNYEMEYVNGTLTITDDAVVTAKSYTREYGEENPTFEYTVDGAMLDGTPAITCEATATSPVGTYDIVISRGDVTNREITYVNGTLTITKAPLKATAKSYTIKRGAELPNFEVEYSGFKNNETDTVFTTKPTVTTRANKNSKPGRYDITVSGAEARNYDIKYVNGTLTIIDKTESFDGNVLTVEEGGNIDDAFESMGGREEAAKTITAIIWNNNEPLTKDMLRGIDNPNMLIYVTDEQLAPSGVNNVVVNGTAKSIVLTDPASDSGNYNFNCPQDFIAESISYTREFKQSTEINVSRGWEAIALPFDVQTFTHEVNGEIAPFNNDASIYHFWLHQITDEGSVTATTIEANKPYIISMPNNETYTQEFNLAGKITFASTNVKVPVTETGEIWLGDTIAVMPTFQRIEKNDMVYALNVLYDFDDYKEGSVFVSNYRDVRPFEVYTFHESHHHNGSGARAISISSLFGGEGTTGIIDVIAEPIGDRWYDMNGRRLQSKPVRKGIYIKNGKKVVIK